MALGFKLKRVTTQNAYTIEKLFDAIKDAEFTAGKPELTKHGMTDVIVFPPLDRNNQVWILPGSFKAPYNKWTIQKNQVAGLVNSMMNDAMGDVTGGITKLSGVFGNNAKNIEQLVVATAEELDALGL